MNKTGQTPTFPLALGKIIIADGALGTQLRAMGSAAALPESLVLDPAGCEMIRKVHASYIEAGAELLETNTFAANPIRLEPHGLADKCEAINEAAVAILRSAIGSRALRIAGSVGPLDLALATRDLDESVLFSAYSRQITALKTAGVDALLLETFSSLLEAKPALRAAQATGLPVLFSLGGQNMARRHARKTVAALVDLAQAHEAIAIGINCMAPYDLTQILPIVREHTDRPLMAFPNAGTPNVVRGAVRFDLSFDVLCLEAAHWAEMGAAILGGCCGTGPAHIAALRNAMAGKPVVQNNALTIIMPAPRPDPRQAPAPAAKNHIRNIIASARAPLVSVEIKPALNRTLQQTVEDMALTAQAAPDFFDVPDNPGASPGRDCVICAHLLQERYGIPAIFHKTATQTNALHLQSYLLGAYDIGLRGVLAVTGDPPSVGTFDRLASRVSDLNNSVELLRCLALMREGELMNGQPLPTAVDFVAGCAMAPVPALKAQTAWLEKKIEAGAEFVFTQPVFSTTDFDALKKVCSSLPIKIFIGIFPIVSMRQAVFLKSGKIPGILAPDTIVKRLAAFEDPADQAKAGIEETKSLIHSMAGRIDGFYLIMPFHKKAALWSAELIKFIKHELPSTGPSSNAG